MRAGLACLVCLLLCGAPGVIVAQTEAPGQPLTPTATADGFTMTFSWAAPATGAPLTGYIVEIGQAPGVYTLLTTDVGLLTSLSFPGPPGTYYFRVSARNRIGTGPPTAEISVTVDGGGSQLPGPPQNLTATAAGNVLTIAWAPPAAGVSISTYVVYVGTAPGQSNLFNSQVGVVTTIGGPVPNGVYYVRVAALNAAGLGPSTAEISVTVGTPPVLPGVPRNLTGSTTGQAVVVTWDEPLVGPPLTGYRLWAGTTPGGHELAAGAPYATRSLAVQMPNGLYYFQVSAVNGAGEGPRSAEILVALNTATVPPSVPRNFTATATGQVLSATWDEPAVGLPLTSYRLWVGTTPGGAQLANGAPYVPRAIAAQMPSGVYYVQVAAVNAAGESPRTAEIMVVVNTATVLPSVPRNLTAQPTHAAFSALAVAWEPPAIGQPILGYRLWVGTTPGGGELADGFPYAQTSFAAPIPDGVYYIRVAAINAVGEGPVTPELVVTAGSGNAVPGPPLNLSGSGANHTLSLNWQPPSSGGTILRYILQVGTSPGVYSLFNGSVGTMTSIASPLGDATYYVRVAAENARGTGEFTPEISVTIGAPCQTPLAPALSGSVGGGRVVSLSWTVPAGPVVGYTLQVGSLTGGSNYLSAPIGLVNSLSGPVSPGTFFIRVAANSTCGVGPPSNEVRLDVP